MDDNMISVDVKLTKGVTNLFHDTLNRGIENGDSPTIAVQRAIRTVWRLAIQAGSDAAVREIETRLAQLSDDDGRVRLKVTAEQLREYLLSEPRFEPTPGPIPPVQPPAFPTALGEAQHVKSVLESMGFAVDVVAPTSMRAYPAPKAPRPAPVADEELPTAPQLEVPPKAPPSPFLGVLRNVFTNAPDLLEKAAEIEQTALRLAPMIEALAGDARVQRLAKTVLQHVQFPPPPPPADEETPPTTRN